MTFIDRADLRARLVECENVELFAAKHWRTQFTRVCRALHLYSGAAHEEFEIVAAEHAVNAQIADAKARGLREAIDRLDLERKAEHAAAE